MLDKTEESQKWTKHKSKKKKKNYPKMHGMMRKTHEHVGDDEGRE